MTYYFDLALRSCRRSKALTALVVMLMGFGVATCMITYAVFRATSADPIPWKSNQLFVPQIDNFGPAHNDQGKPPDLYWELPRMPLQVLLLGAVLLWLLGQLAVLGPARRAAGVPPVEATRSL